MKCKIDYDRLRYLWEHTDLTAKQIAEEFGTTQATIYSTVKYKRFAKRKPSYKGIMADPEKKKWFVRNYPHFSNQTIAVYLHCSLDHVYVLARKLGLKKTDQFHKEAEEYRIKRIRASEKVKNNRPAFLIDPEKRRFIKPKAEICEKFTN